MVSLVTDRLVLRPQTPDDAPFVRDLMNDPDWLLHIGDRGVRTVEEARAYILDGAVRMYEAHGAGLLLVERKEDHMPVGLCGLLWRDFLDDADLGYALAREHRGRGYAREAAAAAVAHGRDALGLERIAALVSPANGASVRVLTDLGFRFDRPFSSPGGGDVHLYALDTRRAPPRVNGR